MPTYEYRCSKGHQFDVFQKMSDEPEATCPECGSPAERLISGGAGFLFKGDGFYITETRSAEYQKKASAEGEPVSGGSADKADKADKKESKPSSGGGSGGSTPAPSSDG